MTTPVFAYFEDDLFSCKIMEVLVTRRMGCSIAIFNESADVIQKLDAMSVTPDMIFLDIHLEPLNGFEILQLLRSHPVYGNTIIVALTASVMNEEIDMLKDAGFDGGIAKPIDQTTFPELIKRLLEGEEIWSIA